MKKRLKKLLTLLRKCCRKYGDSPKRERDIVKSKNRKDVSLNEVGFLEGIGMTYRCEHNHIGPKDSCDKCVLAERDRLKSAMDQLKAHKVTAATPLAEAAVTGWLMSEIVEKTCSS